MRLAKTKLAAAVLTAAMFTAMSGTAAAGPSRPISMTEQIRRELVKIPYLSVFDNLSFKQENGVVTLLGEVTQPYLKDYAEKNVKGVEGVTQVVNQIEVLPLSPFDDSIRFRTLRALERTSSLYRYFMGVNPSIRIIVKNGHVTLDGVVSNAMDRQLAFMAANQVSNVFSVTNNLRAAR
jgi:hyperosmotically inducible protein